MIFYLITFGQYNKKTYKDAEWLIESYLAALIHTGQIDKTCYSIVPWQGQVVAYVNALGIKPDSQQFHCEWGKNDLKKIYDFFGQIPIWTCNEDFPPKKNVTWKNAPFLYFVTDYFERESPVRRGDNGRVIPYFTLPITSSEKDNIYGWTCRYRELDSLWLDSGDFEMSAYRHLAEPDSSLSIEGRECCSVIEKATGVPTYYYLKRYYGREYAEEKERQCPGCGKPWFVKRPEKQIDEHKPWWEFDFMCKKCRLVSSVAPDLNLRYAKIGEPRKNTPSPKRKRGENHASPH